MLDAKITPLINPLLQVLTRGLDRLHISPNQLTVLGFIIGCLALPLLAMHYWLAALAAITINRLLDGLDGALARHQNSQSDAGGYLDICLDFLFYAFIPLGFALADPANNALPAAILLASFIGTGSSFLAFAITAQKHNIEKPQFKYKSFYYLQGLTEGTETILFFIAFCLWPEHFPLLAYSFAVLAFITVLTRIVGGYKTLKNNS